MLFLTSRNPITSINGRVFVLAGALLASAFQTTANAQDIIFQSLVDGVFRTGSQRAIGEADLFVPLLYSDRELLFADLRGKMGDDTTYEGNWGIGYREWLSSDWIVGLYGFFDLRHTANNNDFQQATFGAELMNVNWDFRVNGYVPERGLKAVPGADEGGLPTTPFFMGNGIFVGVAGTTGVETAYYGVDFELGRLLYAFGGPFDAELRGYVGGFHFDTNAVGFPEIAGPRARTELRLFDLPSLGIDSRVVLGAEIQWDEVRHTEAVATIRIRVPLGPSGRMGRPLTPFQRRMVEPVIRDIDIVTNATQSQSQQHIQLTDGSVPITITHVQQGAAGTNLGTFENPFNSATFPATQGTSILYVHANGTYTNGYTAGANQRVLGEGSGNNHVINTDQLGAINLLAGNGGANRPIAQGQFNVASGSELSNFNLQPAGIGIQGNGVAGNININRTLITGGTTGIDIQGGSGTFTFTEVAITDATTAAVNVNGGTATANFDATSTVTQNTNGAAVRVTGGHNAGTLMFASGSTINATNGSGLQFNDADGTYNFNGTTTLNGTGVGADTGIDILNGSTGAFTFAGTTSINHNNANPAFEVNTSTNPSITFSGTINNSNGRVISIQNTAAGANTITFNSAAPNAIQDTGTGIFLNNVAQNIDFNADAELNGGEGIDILGGSGTFTFLDTDINPTGTSGAGLTIIGGTSIVNFQTGSTITQNNTISAVTIDSKTGGSTTFSGLVTANTSTATGIDLTNNAGATITFAGGLNIDTTTGLGFNATGGGTINVNQTAGDESITSTNSRAIKLDGISGNIGFDTISSTNAGANSGITINNFGDGSSFTVNDGNAATTNDATVNGTNAGIAGINISNSRGTFTLDGVDIDNTGGHGIALSNNATTAININGGTIDGVMNNNDGINSTNTNFLHVYSMQFGATSAITGDGIEVLNNDAISRSVEITNSNIGIGNATGNRGILINSNGTGTLTATLTGNAINSTNQTIRTNDGGTAGSLVLDLQNSTLTRNTAGFTQEHVGLGTDSTIVRSWSGPNQVVGGVGGGILFDRISFDASGTSLADTQVAVGGTGVIEIGSAGGRVQGDGLSFINPSGAVSIPTLNIFNNAGAGLKVDTKGLGTSFSLATGGGTVDTTNGPALDLDPPVGLPPLSIGMTLDQIVTSGSPGYGVIINNVVGYLTVTGTTTVSDALIGDVSIENADELDIQLNFNPTP